MVGLFGSIFGNYDDNDNDNHSDDKKRKDEGRLTLHKEELDINKNRVHKGEVELGKEIVEEQKTVDVPVTHEEVVIERRAIDNEASDTPISDEETIRIPVSEEQVNVDKHTLVTGEVSAHKRELQDTRRVDESLKREEARIKTHGDANIVDKDTDEGFH
ncbi:YsnF/AvaK domain-containing protein [Clostridium botulinum]